MASLVIRNIDENTTRTLKARARSNGTSVQDEVRTILKTALASNTGPGLATSIVALFKPVGGVELKLPVREAMRTPPRFTKRRRG
jgi:antitoxin FitA